MRSGTVRSGRRRTAGLWPVPSSPRLCGIANTADRHTVSDKPKVRNFGFAQMRDLRLGPTHRAHERRLPEARVQTVAAFPFRASGPPPTPNRPLCGLGRINLHCELPQTKSRTASLFISRVLTMSHPFLTSMWE